MSEDNKYAAQIAALVKFLDDDTQADDVSVDEFGGYPVFSVGGKAEYRVLTNEEADGLVEDEIRDSLWAFNADFICTFCDLNDEKTIAAVQKMQEKLCESANPIIERLIGADLPDFIEEAIAADGRGHFLSSYDGRENEEDGFFIYQIN